MIIGQREVRYRESLDKSWETERQRSDHGTLPLCLMIVIYLFDSTYVAAFTLMT